MKKITILLSFVSTITFAQINHNHPQSFDGYGWGEKNSNNIVLSAGKYSESYIINFDLTNGNYTYLNDSSSLRLTNFRMIGDTGIARSGTGAIYYTHNNWKDIIQTTVSFETIIKTNSGFLGKKSISSTSAEYYHSTDGNTWTLALNAPKGSIAYHNSKTWVGYRPNNFYVSYDGGLTFVQKNPIGAPSTTLLEFIPLDTLNAIGIVSGSLWYYTLDGGNMWSTFPSFPSSASFIYAAKLDTIYANFTSTGLNMSVDTGNTWQPSSIPLPENTAARMYRIGNYLVSQIGWNGQFATFSSQGIGKPWSQMHKRVLRTDYNDVCFKGNKGIIVGDGGIYSYSHDKGKTYNIAPTTLGTQDLKACEVFNDTLMLVGDRQSNIYVSTDAGLTWNKRYSNSLNYISKKFRASSDLLTIVLFRNGQNLVSTNKGLSWNIKGSIGGAFDGTVTPAGKILILTGANIEEMNKSNGNRTNIKTFTEPNIQGVVLEMIDDNNGYVVAINNTDTTTVIFKTTDGWATYTKTGTINSVLTIEPNPISPSFPYGMSLGLNIISPDTLYINRFNTSNASISSNIVYKSFNGGASWTTDSIVTAKQGGTTDRLQGMHYFAGEKFVSVWEDGRIYLNNELKGSSTPSAIVENISERVTTVNAYPNPFNNSFNIESTKAIEEITVIDISGKVILSENPMNTIHKIETTNYPRGVYFVSVVSNNKRQLVKLVKQ